MKKSLRILSLLLALVFLLSLAPMAAFAEGEEPAPDPAPEPVAAPAPAPAAAPVGQTVIPDNPAGTTVETVDSDEKMNTNEGTVTTNEGTVTTNEGTVTTNEGEIDTNNGTVTTNEAGGQIDTNNGTVTTNEGEIDSNNGTVTTNKAGGKIDTNNGTVTTNEGEININTGTVTDNKGTVEYNAGGTVNGGTVENNGYGVKLNNFDGNTARNFYGTGVVANSDKTAAFVPKKTSDLEVVFQHQDGCDMNIDSGGVGYRYVYNAGVWMVSFDEVVNNLKIFFTKAVDREPTLEEQYMDFIYSVARKIREAKKDSTVEIDAGYWLSYRTEVFQALADRPDVSLKTTYRRDGKTMRFTIPAGTDVLTAVYPEVVVEYPKLAELLHITPEQVK